LTHWPWLIFIAIYGACVGSFLNVVIHRVPQGRSLWRPPSSCPRCGHRLAWYDNVPVLGWLWLRGRCRYCRAPISVQYPLIEALTAALFAGVYWLDYLSGWRRDFQQAGLGATWPALIVQLALVGGLLAATVIDARLYLIPLRIPYTVILVGLLILPTAAAFMPAIRPVTPAAGPPAAATAAGSVVGLALALLLLRMKLLPRSFDELEHQLNQPEPPDAFLSHPHPRAEVLKECLFLLLPLAGALGGYWLGSGIVAGPGAGTEPHAGSVLGGMVFGYLVGGGLVWGVRIFGTLAFGREAMGLGDVHLLAAIGAVMGWLDAVFVFFIAPFLGLAGAVAAKGVTRVLRGQERVIPYGPYLAGAAVLVMAAHQLLRQIFGILQV
jgi:leader peptidase (prepilin peptidase)/N-methyltransferase